MAEIKDVKMLRPNISIHAVSRFKERIADLPTSVIRILIWKTLQDNSRNILVQNWNKKQCPIYRATYKDIEYYIPVIYERIKMNAWPVVPTILLSDMETNFLYEKRNGWIWKL